MHPSVTEFLGLVWKSPAVNQQLSLTKLEDAIYDLYTPPPPKGVSEQWTQIDYHRQPSNPMGWRVYISATQTSLMKVWNMLRGLFVTQHGVVAAKYTTPQAAAFRMDTIVIYLRDSSAKDTFIAGMRTLFDSRPGVGGAPTIPPRLRAGDFKDGIPPTTEQVQGLRGVSHAQQPLADGWAAQEEPIPTKLSFGMQLASMVAKAYKGAPSKEAFFSRVEANFLEYGMDVNRPWQYLLTQATRDQLVASAEASRRRRANKT